MSSAPAPAAPASGIEAAKNALAAQRAEGAKQLKSNGLAVNPQTTHGNPSEAARALAQRGAEVRAQARQAEAAKAAQEADAAAKADAEAGNDAANNPGEGTDGLESSDQLQSGGDGAAEADGQSDAGADDPEAFDQAAIDLGEGVTMSRAEIKQHLMRQSDYTQKTQGLSAKEKAFEADRTQRLGVLDSLIGQFATQIGQPKSLKSWLAEDPIDGLARFAEQQERMEQLHAARTVRAQEQAHHTSQARDSTVKALMQTHGDKAQGYFDQAVEYASTRVGLDKDTLAGLMAHPEAIQMAHEARQWRELQASQKSVQRTVAGKPAVIRPGTRVSAQAGAQSAFQKSMTALKASGSIADAKAAMQARRATQR